MFFLYFFIRIFKKIHKFFCLFLFFSQKTNDQEQRFRLSSVMLTIKTYHKYTKILQLTQNSKLDDVSAILTMIILPQYSTTTLFTELVFLFF